MTTPRPGSRAEQRRRTEARILDAATQAFFGAGYDRTTIRAVASAAGVDAGLVMHYFGSKQELYRRVIDAAPVPEISGAPGQAAEQILATLADRLVRADGASLALLRSMLTNPEAASAASDGIARYEAQIAQAIPADDADLRAAIISAVTLGITVSRHLVKADELATADPAQIVRLLRPCLLSLTGQPEISGPSLRSAGLARLPGMKMSTALGSAGGGAGAVLFAGRVVSWWEACAMLGIAVAAFAYRLLAERGRRKTLEITYRYAPPNTELVLREGPGGPAMWIQVGDRQPDRPAPEC